MQLLFFLVLAAITTAAWAQGLEPPAPAAQATFDPFGIGDVSFPAALVICTWLLTKWHPEFRFHVELGSEARATAESMTDRLAKVLETLHNNAALFFGKRSA